MNMPVKPIIKTEGLWKSFEQHDDPVLKNIEIAIPIGKLVIIYGQSGSGKSTLMHILGGLLTPTKGRLWVNNFEINKNSKLADLAIFRQKTVGFVFQSFHLLPGMSAWQNVGYPLRLSGHSIKTINIRKMAVNCLKEVGLEEEHFEKNPDILSGGQKQRVAIARALINDPEIILADEPTGNLDTDRGSKIMDLLEKFRDRGKTVIIVSHNEKHLSRADFVINIEDGKIIGGNSFESGEK